MGELQDELETQWPRKGAHGSLFTSLGPKTYALRVTGGGGEHLADIVRYKGVIMSSAVAKAMTLDVMRELVTVDGSERREVEQVFFRKDVAKQRVEAMTVLKTCRFTSSKRRFIIDSPRLETRPFGFIE